MDVEKKAARIERRHVKKLKSLGQYEGKDKGDKRQETGDKEEKKKDKKGPTKGEEAAVAAPGKPLSAEDLSKK